MPAAGFCARLVSGCWLFKYLKTRDLVVIDPAGDWDLVVPLMQRWLRLRAERR